MSEEISLTSLEDKFIVQSSGLSRHRPGLYPSEASVVYQQDGMRCVAGKCLRAAWYRAKKVPKSDPAGPRLQSTGDLGKWCEEGLIERWKKMGIWVDNNVKFYKQDLILSGELDAVLRISNKLIGYEVKSFYNYFAQKEILGTKRPEVPGKPKENQMLQALVYSWEYKDELDQFRMRYIERGNGIRVDFEVGCEKTPSPDGTHRCWYRQIPGDYWNTFDKEIVYLPYTIEDIHDRYRALIKYIRENTIPDGDFQDVFSAQKVEDMWKRGKIAKTNYEKWQKNPSKNPIGNWECSWCSHKSQCKADNIKKTIDK